MMKRPLFLALAAVLCVQPVMADGLTPKARRELAARNGGVLDEPATAKAMAWFLGRGVDCGALTEAEVRAATGLDRSGLDAVRVSGHAPQPVAG